MNKTKFKIAITQRMNFSELRNEISDSLDHNLIKLLLDIGFCPIIVPNIFKNKKLFVDWINCFKPDGFVLSGGNDLKEFLLRDKTEMFILNYASERNIPLLGVCKGMQMMAVWDGTNLVKVKNHVRTHHKNNKKNFPKLINSFHDFGILECPKNFNVLLKEKDGVIEAFAHKSLPWEGWMWHPERDRIIDSENILRIKNLFKFNNK
jgi:N5-(cytidine 5'-diphosphoramidyl)-L-glutamine hydrolase